MITAITLTAAATLGWVYVGYPLTLAAVAPRSKAVELEDAPHVTLIIPAYNELGEVLNKVANTDALRYPYGKLDVLWVTDGSTDGSNMLLESLGIPVIHSPRRRGKAAAINRAMAHVKTPFVIFTDANTRLEPDAIYAILQPFADPSVGCVAGAKRVRGGGSEAGEGLYWRYEDRIKRLESALHSTIGAAGELVAVRTELFEPLPEDAILDDFILSMRLVLRGFRTVYAPNAIAIEGPSAQLRGDFERRARIAAGGLQAMAQLPGLLRPDLVGPAVTGCYVSHRVLRWTLAPAALFVLPPALVIQAMLAPTGLNLVLAIGQLTLLLAVAVKLLRASPSGTLGTIAYFYLANAAIISGWLRFATGSQSATWARVARANAS